MTLWFVFALMTAAAVFAVLWPLSRRDTASGGSDIAVYRDQLEEVARDRAAGLIGVAEAEAAKVEVSRRLLAAADAADAKKTPAPPPLRRRRFAAIAGLVLLPAGAVALYLMLGSPLLPGEPLATRQREATANQPIEKLVAQVEAHVAKHPDDGRGWEVIAPVYLRLGRFEDSVRAWRNAIRLNGSTASRESDLGEALVAVHNGLVTVDAKAAFDRAQTLDVDDAKSRFYIGLAAEQDGRRDEAEKIWRAMLEKAPAGAPWVTVVQQAIARVAPGSAPVAVAPAPNLPRPRAPGPSAEDIAAAQQMKPEDQNQMIAGMVARLADKLKQDGSDVDGWLRLLRAYKVLGDKDKAQAAAADARRALAGEPDKLRRVDELVKELGLQG
ncbi:MAG: c-type cytochrome biogenesis protein CcmI [Pseudolabrys sp.]